MELLKNMMSDCTEGNISWFPDRQKKLYDLVFEKKPSCILEIGFNMGHSALLICKAIREGKTINETSNEKSNFYIFDICEHKCVKKNFEILKEEFKNEINLHLIEGDTMETLEKFDFQKIDSIDFAEVDGCHSYKCVQSDIKNIIEYVSVGGIIYVDDYKSSKINLTDVNEGVDDLDWSNFLTNTIDGVFWSEKKII